ncbi:MAG TPA: alpha amylase C-terminal domain-containing protein, partial [Isosphaeraceae bacterium]|nr:alpha amylase C-terminal domain-containing protein [Isosphaeraceae bacterium]
RFPGRLMIAEDLRENAAMTRDVAAGGAGFHTQWDGRSASEIRTAVITPADQDRSMQAVRDAIATRFNDDAFQRIIYSESHDDVANGKARLPTEINRDDPRCWDAQKRSTLAAALVLTAPGIPMLFQGQEFLEDEWFRAEVPLDWDRRATFRGLVRLYRDLIALRRDHRGCTRGLCGQNLQVHHVDEQGKVLAFHRWDQGGPGDDVVVVANFRRESQHDSRIGFPAEGLWKLRFSSDRRDYSEQFEGLDGGDAASEPGECDGLPARARITIAPYTVMIFSQDRR